MSEYEVEEDLNDDYEREAPPVNDNLAMIVGETGTGKSMSLMGMRHDPGILYLNCESGKKLPFKDKFLKVTITDPMDIYAAFEDAEEMDDIHTIVIDTATYMMNMFESVHVIGSDNTMQQWGAYAQFWKNLMQYYVAKSSKNVIILAHTSEVYDKEEMVNKVVVPVKGSLAKEGLESYFSFLIATKKVLIKDLKGFENEFLHITEEEEELGYKHVFQTRLTKATINERIRGPFGMWDRNETYIDNNITYVLNRLHEYYNEEDEE
jgi:hypothetical protein